MKREQAALPAQDIGFSHWGIFSVSALKFLPEVRDACASDRCGRYGKSWSCPPACGTLEECAAAAKK